GDAVVEREKRISSVKYFFEVHAYKDSILCFHTFYFPGWRVFVDGKETPIDPDNESGLIVFKVPSGKHKVIIHFGLSSVRLAGILISIASLAFLFFLIFFKKIWGKRISV
ncbi:MAG TPA: YfhO family protein, partial [Candidatus Omnitrophota bacterium]|nr:YfhO family protein [Candidatus Omnitrophota bacterium]